MGIKVKTQNEVIELKNFNAISGGHCESSAMLNALSYQGVNISECAINGFASSMSFSFTSEEKFPFLSLRTPYLKENFINTTDIKIKEHQPTTPQQAYDETKEVLRKGIPVVLRVDMRYLTYLHGGKYGRPHTSFGWHFITLVKIDETEGFAWVTDTEYKSLQKIKITDLAMARNSKKGELKADNYYYYFVDPKKVEIDISSAFKKSMEGYISNYEGDDGIINLMESFAHDIKHIEDSHNSFMMTPMFFTWYGFIEVFGTGGCGFRKFFYDYLKEMGKEMIDINLHDMIDAADESCRCWSTLAAKLQSISKTIKSIRNKQDRYELYAQAAELAEKVYKAEVDIYNELKKIHK